MNKSGFTLTELLTVLVVLFVILSIAYPVITKSTRTYKNDLYLSQVESIKNAASSYVTDNINDINCSSVGVDNEIELSTLQNNGYIDDKIKNPKTKDLFSSNSKVIVNCKIVNDNYKFTYQFNEV